MFLKNILVPLFYFGVEVSRVFGEEVEIRQVAADKGTNVTIPCGGLLVVPPTNVLWVHRGNRTHHEVLVSLKFFYINIYKTYLHKLDFKNNRCAYYKRFSYII
ncbi:hypothetical protein KGM_200837 [Danaus plexippus plexippus]|uniref:Uncharacterized protein n=1 Tax=Danaus plexippus plexippus TaxID=278856 RepID=A0A212F5I2_DANPL|nr:hypothetical protein KGM_200837 [Danaus plexippus plexippus]